MNPLAERLIQARKAAGYETATEAARALDIPYQTYVAHENPNARHAFRRDSAVRYATKFHIDVDWLLTGKSRRRDDNVIPTETEVAGLPVYGNIQAGHWLETTFLDAEGDLEMLPVARDSRFPRARQYALRVVGDSMDQEYPDGSYVTCVDFVESGLGIVEGMTVHVERHRAGGQLVEITLKTVGRQRGQWILEPRSNNPQWTPLTFSGNESEIIIRGVVTGGWRRTDIPT